MSIKNMEMQIDDLKEQVRESEKENAELKEKLKQIGYFPTRLDYFIAHIVTGCLAKSCGSSNPKEIVDYAKELIAEIDEQEGEK